jgi:hypothetical protein
MEMSADAGVTAALWGLDAAFVDHPPRMVLEGCSHCHGVVRVADADPFALALGLGVTIGRPSDVRALTPWLMRQVVLDGRIDLHTVLSRIAEYWRDWTERERSAVRDVVEAMWVAALDSRPEELTAVAFLDGASGLEESPHRLLEIWEYKDTASADEHLAELVVDTFYGARVPAGVTEWAAAEPQRERLRRAMERDRGEPWAGTIAAACELLPRPGAA